tara:strand:+ start:342 stop:497 length:156 start_codon:yes stop_codon:yes gene_type:complete
MLVDLSKKELAYLITSLSVCKKMGKETEDTKLLFNKLKNISQACTCKENNQ